ncbi:MAG: hypothetical protein ABI778_00540, partial [Ignavibacteriota bacterium]
MTIRIDPARGVRSAMSAPTMTITLPPDKSIFHRLLIIGSLTSSKITIPIPSIEEIPVDIYATILGLQSLGVPIEILRSKIELEGVGVGGFRAPTHQLN